MSHKNVTKNNFLIILFKESMLQVKNFMFVLPSKVKLIEEIILLISFKLLGFTTETVYY